MPGFLIFEEFGLDPDMPGAGLAKAALGMVPMSWMLHGLGGEYNVDVDPIGLRQPRDRHRQHFVEPHVAHHQLERAGLQSAHVEQVADQPGRDIRRDGRGRRGQSQAKALQRGFGVEFHE